MDARPDPNVDLRLLSYNIQAGAQTTQYADYVTRGWQQVLPFRGRGAVVAAVGQAVRSYDVVGLQEADHGSLRSAFLNQPQFVAEHGDFPYFSQQSNRRVSRLASTGNALLSRIRPQAVEDHRLPGRVPGRTSGRGALVARFGDAALGLTIANVHLALSRRARRSQLDFLAERLAGCRYAIVMGDFNAPLHAPEIQAFLERSELLSLPCDLSTFPSWRPARRIDHMFFSPDVQLNAATVLPIELSDHCPVAADVSVPVSAMLHHPAAPAAMPLQAKVAAL